MQYYIKEENWKQILEFIKSVKGMHSKDEKRLRIFIEAVWYSPSHNSPKRVRYGFIVVEVSMPAAYSYDLRKKVMEALDEGESGENVAKRFKIGKTTLYEWKKRREKTGDFQSKKPGSVGYNHKITDWNAFTEFANEQGGKTQSEMAKLWGNISRQTIHRALKNIGFTRKKRPTDIKKEMRKSELNLQGL